MIVSPGWGGADTPSFKNVSGNTWGLHWGGRSWNISGPFASLVPAYRYTGIDSFYYDPHSISRNLYWGITLEYWSRNFTQDAVDKVMAEQTFDAFQELFYRGPHTAIHEGVGGDSM